MNTFKVVIKIDEVKRSKGRTKEIEFDSYMLNEFNKEHDAWDLVNSILAEHGEVARNTQIDRTATINIVKPDESKTCKSKLGFDANAVFDFVIQYENGLEIAHVKRSYWDNRAEYRDHYDPKEYYAEIDGQDCFGDSFDEILDIYKSKKSVGKNRTVKKSKLKKVTESTFQYESEKIGYQYNLPTNIIDLANKKGLDAIATGGNCDYIYKDLGNGQCMILADPEETSYISKNPKDRANVIIQLNEHWNESIEIEFPTIEKAMDFMANNKVTIIGYTPQN